MNDEQFLLNDEQLAVMYHKSLLWPIISVCAFSDNLDHVTTLIHAKKLI